MRHGLYELECAEEIIEPQFRRASLTSHSTTDTSFPNDFLLRFLAVASTAVFAITVVVAVATATC